MQREQQRATRRSRRCSVPASAARRAARPGATSCWPTAANTQARWSAQFTPGRHDRDPALLPQLHGAAGPGRGDCRRARPSMARAQLRTPRHALVGSELRVASVRKLIERRGRRASRRPGAGANRSRPTSRRSVCAGSTSSATGCCRNEPLRHRTRRHAEHRLRRRADPDRRARRPPARPRPTTAAGLRPGAGPAATRQRDAAADSAEPTCATRRRPLPTPPAAARTEAAARGPRRAPRRRGAQGPDAPMAWPRLLTTARPPCPAKPGPSGNRPTRPGQPAPPGDDARMPPDLAAWVSSLPLPASGPRHDGCGCCGGHGRRVRRRARGEAAAAGAAGGRGRSKPAAARRRRRPAPRPVPRGRPRRPRTPTRAPRRRRCRRCQHVQRGADIASQPLGCGADRAARSRHAAPASGRGIGRILPRAARPWPARRPAGATPRRRCRPSCRRRWARAEFAPALGAQLSVLVRDGVEHAQLQLNPAEMGPIEVQHRARRHAGPGRLQRGRTRPRAQALQDACRRWPARCARAASR